MKHCYVVDSVGMTREGKGRVTRSCGPAVCGLPIFDSKQSVALGEKEKEKEEGRTW
jgi:hypothetical protein